MEKTINWPVCVCPIHKKQLIEKENTLHCAPGEIFPIREGISLFCAKQNYADSFGVQWNRFRETQLDSYIGLSISRERARHCIGNDLWDNLQEKHVLECGCGAGRFTEIFLQKGAYVTSVDISEAVFANRDNFIHTRYKDRHRVIQAEIIKLPFYPRQFDIVFCLGVIQHTPNPDKTIAALYEQVKPGGALIIDQFAFEVSWYTKTAFLLRHLFLNLPIDKRLNWIEKIVGFLLPIHKAVCNHYFLQILLSRFSPVISYYHIYPELKEKLQREWAFLDTHDTLTARYRYFTTKKHILNLFKLYGLEDAWCEYRDNLIKARGKRPSSGT